MCLFTYVRLLNVYNLCLFDFFSSPSSLCLVAQSTWNIEYLWNNSSVYVRRGFVWMCMYCTVYRCLKSHQSSYRRKATNFICSCFWSTMLHTTPFPSRNGLCVFAANTLAFWNSFLPNNSASSVYVYSSAQPSASWLMNAVHRIQGPAGSTFFLSFFFFALYNPRVGSTAIYWFVWANRAIYYDYMYCVEPEGWPATILGNIFVSDQFYSLCFFPSAFTLAAKDRNGTC